MRYRRGFWFRGVHARTGIGLFDINELGGVLLSLRLLLTLRLPRQGKPPAGIFKANVKLLERGALGHSLSLNIRHELRGIPGRRKRCVSRAVLGL